jgi:SDR family mycofactocin-dependent oxidoreductase
VVDWGHSRSTADRRIDNSDTDGTAMGLFDGKVAFITGAARGQGRSHAVRFAEEGADIIAFDLCSQIDSVVYPMSAPEDLDETVNLVEKTGRRIVAEQGDVRDFGRLQSVVSNGVGEFGRIDYVLANAGIYSVLGEQASLISAYLDAIDVCLNGVYYTIEAALPALLKNDEGGAIVISSSTAGNNSLVKSFDLRSHGVAGYHAAKHGVIGLMRYYATSLAEYNIRANTVHPTGVATPMLLNEPFGEFFAANPEAAEGLKNLLPIDLIEAADITNAMVYLCGPTGRYVTGTTMLVDAGLTAR